MLFNLVKVARSVVTLGLNVARLRAVQYPVLTTGTGDMDVVCVGMGSLLQKTFSEEFRGLATIYSSDLYWTRENKLDNPELLTMDMIVEDMQALVDQVGLDNFVLAGHSCFGIPALEIAKVDPRVSGVMLIGSPPAWNAEHAAFSDAYFKEHASAERKANDAARRAHFEKVKGPVESEVSVNSYEREAARYFVNYDITRGELDDLWDGVIGDDAVIDQYFEFLLPEHDIYKTMDQVKAPVLLLGGPKDYDCLPLLMWDRASEKPADFTIVECPNSGHWPNLEDAEVFDKGVASWAREQELFCEKASIEEIDATENDTTAKMKI